MCRYIFLEVEVNAILGISAHEVPRNCSEPPIVFLENTSCNSCPNVHVCANDCRSYPSALFPLWFVDPTLV